MILRYHAKYNKRSGEEQFWTHENHAVELSTNSLIETRLNYIHENSVRAGIVAETEDYLYSSAINYAEMESLIEIDLNKGIHRGSASGYRGKFENLRFS